MFVSFSCCVSIMSNEKPKGLLNFGKCGQGHGNIQRLNARHFKIIDYCLAGKTHVEIAGILQMTARSVGLVVNSSSFQHELALRREVLNEKIDDKILSDIDAVQENLNQAVLSAAKKLIGLMDSGEEGIALRAASTVLDRGGYPAVTKTIGSVTGTIGIDKKAAKLIRESLKMDKD